MWGYKEYLSEKIHFRPVWGNIFLKSNSSIYYSISKGGREGFVSSWSYFGEGNGNPLQYSCLENPMDGEAWKAAVHGVAKSRTRLSDFIFTFTFMHWRRKWQPLQCSCVENPRDGRVWWAAIYEVAQSWKRLKQLSSSSRSYSLTG